MPLRAVTTLASRLLNRLRSMPVATRSPSPPSGVPAAKRARLSLSPVAPRPTEISVTTEQVDVKPSRKMKAKLHGAQEAHSRKLAEAEVEPDEVLRARVEEIMSEPVEFETKYAYELDYRNKLVLAPMVRTGTLPTRLLSLYYGAGLVWSPEIVDKAIIGAERTVDPKTGVITYSKGQGAIFTTHPIEKPYLVFQIGSSDPELAVQAAKVVEQDVSGIDLNCGCPKPFSTHAGMGAALLSTPDILLNILRSLLREISIPISCKIRMLPTQEATRVLVSRILKTGIRNLTVHCRTRDMRPHEKAMWERLRDLVELGDRRGVPVACNGDGEGWANWEQIKRDTGASTAMLARSAEKNPSVFAPKMVGTVEEVIPHLLNVAEYTDNAWGNTKFLLMQFKPSPSPVSNLPKHERKKVLEAVSRSKSAEMLAETMGIQLGKGEEFMKALEEKLKARQGASALEGGHEKVFSVAGEAAGEEAQDREQAVESAQDDPEAVNGHLERA